MELSDLAEEVLTKELRTRCIGKKVVFIDLEGLEITIRCKTVKFETDDGDCWIRFVDDSGNVYITDGQGLDIWFEIENE